MIGFDQAELTIPTATALRVSAIEAVTRKARERLDIIWIHAVRRDSQNSFDAERAK